MKKAIALGGILALTVVIGGCARHGPGHGFGHGAGPCGGDRDEVWAARMLARVERRLELRPEQKPAWDRVAADFQRAVADTCAAATAGGEPSTAPAAVARLERVVSAGAAGLGRLRPGLDALYASLDEEQRQELDRLLAHRRFG